MIQDIYPKKLINHYDAGKRPSQTMSPVLRFNDKGAFLVRETRGRREACYVLSGAEGVPDSIG
jgi:hypothetical protein